MNRTEGNEKRRQIFYSCSRDQLERWREYGEDTVRQDRILANALLVELLVDLNQLGTLVGLDSVPRGGVLLGPDDCGKSGSGSIEK